MKKIIAVILFVCVVVISFVAINVTKSENKEYLRIHIRANSNSELDQQVKYKVRDRVVEFLTPYIATLKTKEEAEKFLQENMDKIESVANSVLEENGFSYTSLGKVTNEKFPTRVYQDVTLESGYYDALILELGSGKGDNWWCVVYPPLCFVGSGTSYVYKSKIKEIIDNFFLSNDKGQESN